MTVVRTINTNGCTTTYTAGNDGFTSLSAMVRDVLLHAHETGKIAEMPSRADIGKLTAALARSSFRTIDYTTWANEKYNGDTKELAAALERRAQWYKTSDEGNGIAHQPLAKGGKKVPFVEIDKGEKILISYDTSAGIIIHRLKTPGNGHVLTTAV